VDYILQSLDANLFACVTTSVLDFCSCFTAVRTWRMVILVWWYKNNFDHEHMCISTGFHTTWYRNIFFLCGLPYT
jgi:hypothetical protein